MVAKQYAHTDQYHFFHFPARVIASFAVQDSLIYEPEQTRLSPT